MIIENNITSNICIKCNGTAKPSKALVNFHNIRASFLRSEKEFYTKLINVNKCSSCGHSWTN